MQTCDDLERFELPGSMAIEYHATAGPILSINHHGHKARISLFGAQLLEWQPAGHAPVLWLSKAAQFDQQRAIRGGVPICWPWFGGHAEHKDWPSHGFARTSLWQLEEVSAVADEITIRLSLPVLPQHAQFSGYSSRPLVTYTIGATLRMVLETANIDSELLQYSQALHTYFSVDAIEDISITGLEASPHLDQLTGAEVAPSATPISFSGETDRIYHKPQSPIQLHDPGNGRVIDIEHDGATSAVVWNPWTDKTIRMGDMGEPDAYRGMVCIETGNIAPHEVVLEPGEMHRLETRIWVRSAA